MPDPLAILRLETLQVAEVAPLMRDAYLTSRPVFGELRRVDGEVWLFAGTVDRPTALKIQKLLNPPQSPDAKIAVALCTEKT